MCLFRINVSIKNINNNVLNKLNNKKMNHFVNA